MVDYILSKPSDNAPFVWEDVENPCYKDVCEDCGEQEEHKNHNTDVSDEDRETHEFIPQTKEIYEWWLVSNWLCEKLAEEGESVIPHENIWGRTTTGQAILLDGVITRIQQKTEYGAHGTKK
jgi:hypothetical protein